MTFDISALRSESYYDCAEIGGTGFVPPSYYGDNRQGGQHSLKLFGNANIGNIDLTNLQVAGQMPGHLTFIVQRWYARDNLPDDPAIRNWWRAWANSVTVQFVVGYNHVWTRNLFELSERRPRTTDGPTPRTAADPIPVLIPPRQSFDVRMDQFGPAIGGLASLLAAIPMLQPRVWIHLEGVVVNHDTKNPSLDAILAALMNTAKEHQSAEERIAQWLGAQLEGAGNDELRAQLHAMRDGIMEGRHRS